MQRIMGKIYFREIQFRKMTSGYRSVKHGYCLHLQDMIAMNI